MRLYTLLDNLTSTLACVDGKVTSPVSMLSPIEPVQLAKLFQRTATSGPDHQQMDMVGRHMPADAVYTQRRAGLAHQLTQPHRDFPSQDQLALSGDPHQMVFQDIDRVGYLSIALNPLRYPTATLTAVIASGRASRYLFVGWLALLGLLLTSSHLGKAPFLG